jgi:hypothetical protein
MYVLDPRTHACDCSSDSNHLDAPASHSISITLFPQPRSSVPRTDHVRSHGGPQTDEDSPVSGIEVHGHIVVAICRCPHIRQLHHRPRTSLLRHRHRHPAYKAARPEGISTPTADFDPIPVQSTTTPLLPRPPTALTRTILPVPALPAQPTPTPQDPYPYDCGAR